MMPTQRDPRPLSPTQTASSHEAAGTIPIGRPVYRWYHKLSAAVLIALCVEIGLFLLVFPWTGYWENNYFSSVLPEWRRYWMNPYWRGAVSGLGVANLFLAVSEIFRLRRFAGKS
jgi:hypothetical protein